MHTFFCVLFPEDSLSLSLSFTTMFAACFLNGFVTLKDDESHYWIPLIMLASAVAMFFNVNSFPSGVMPMIFLIPAVGVSLVSLIFTSYKKISVITGMMAAICIMLQRNDLWFPAIVLIGISFLMGFIIKIIILSIRPNLKKIIRP